MNKSRTHFFERPSFSIEFVEQLDWRGMRDRVTLSPRFDGLLTSCDLECGGLILNGLLDERRAFLAARDRAAASSLQIAAAQLSCGIDLAALMSSPPAERRQAVRRLERFVERERLKGLSRHWSYDLNRHIALVQALDALDQAAGPKSHAHAISGNDHIRSRRQMAP